jgi:hypothetical protein
MKTTKRIRAAAIGAAIFAAAMVGAIWAESRQQQTPDSASDSAAKEGSSDFSHKSSYTVEVSGSKQWTDTSIDLRGGGSCRSRRRERSLMPREIILARWASRGALRM